MSDSQRTFYSTLVEDGEIKANHRLAKKYRKELDDLGVFSYDRRGKIEWLVVKEKEILDTIISKKYPNGLNFQAAGRVGGILTSRDSKKGGNASKTFVMLRFMSKSSDDGFGFQCYNLTQKNGLVSLIIDESNTMLNGLVVIVENFDCFLSAEKFVDDADVVVYSNGRLGKKVITWLSQCDKIDRIVHMGDYDPVGLSEFIRIEDGSNHQTEFYFHPALDETIFRTYGKASLVSDSKNAKSLEKARTHSSSDEGFNATLDLILSTGLGLEQEFLLSL